MKKKQISQGEQRLLLLILFAVVEDKTADRIQSACISFSLINSN